LNWWLPDETAATDGTAAVHELFEEIEQVESAFSEDWPE
jgi:hypothetical protein